MAILAFAIGNHLILALVSSMKSGKQKGGTAVDSMVCANCLASEESASKHLACARCGLVVYCSKDCQRAHWKANHKQHCVAKNERTPQYQASIDVPPNGAPVLEKNCAICLEQLQEASACTLPCMHIYHSKCVTELRKFGVNQACPL